MKEALLKLPEPILLIGNKMPDGDSVGTLSALLAFLRLHNKEAYAFFKKEIPSYLSWMISEDDVCEETFLEEYEALIVVDDSVCSKRLGISIRDVPIINIDHHSSNPLARPFLEESTIDSENDREGNDCIEIIEETQTKEGLNVSLFWAEVPATACVLIDHEIYHPYLWVSIATDTVFFTVSNLLASEYIVSLTDGLVEEGYRHFDDELISSYMRELQKPFPRSSLDALYNAEINFYDATHKGEKVHVVVGKINTIEAEASKHILSVLRKFSDITVVIDLKTKKVSLRSSVENFKVRKIAESLGGGGHDYAAGCTLPLGPLSISEFEETLIREFETTRAILYL